MSSDSCSTVHHVVFYSVVSKETGLQACSSPNAPALKALSGGHPGSPHFLLWLCCCAAHPTRLTHWFRASKSPRGLKNFFFFFSGTDLIAYYLGLMFATHSIVGQGLQSKRSDMILRLYNGSLESIMSCNNELLFDK